MSNVLSESAAPVRQWHHVDRDIFEKEIAPLGVPAVLKNYVADWPAVKLAAQAPDVLCDYLRSISLEKPVQSFNGTPEMRGRFFYEEDMRGFNFERRNEPLSHVLDRLLEHIDTPSPPYFYAGAVNVPENLPDFSRDHQMALLPSQMEQLTSIWVGNKTRIPIHWDLPQNIACVVAGRRQFTLFPVDQLKNLYIGPIDFTIAGQPCSLVDLHHPDVQKFPKFKEAAKQALMADLEPGDALYIPSLWFHHVEALDPFGMLVNFWWRDGPDYMFTPLYTLMHALLTIREMPASERMSWRTMFDHYIFQTGDDPAMHIPPEARGILGEMTPQKVGALRHFLARQLDPKL